MDQEQDDPEITLDIESVFEDTPLMEAEEPEEMSVGPDGSQALQELHLVCDPHPGQEVPSTELEIEEDTVEEPTKPRWDNAEMDDMTLEVEESGRHIDVETTSSTQDYNAMDVLVFGVITWLFIGPAATLTWMALGCQLIMIGMVMAGIAIVPIFLVTPLLAFPLCFVPILIYRRVKRKENPRFLQIVLILVICALLWLQALLVYLWANGKLPFWSIVLADGILIILGAGALLLYEFKRRQRTRSYVRVTTHSTHETVYCQDVYGEEVEQPHYDSEEEDYTGIDNGQEPEEEEEEEDLFGAPMQQQDRATTSTPKQYAQNTGKRRAW